MSFLALLLLIRVTAASGAATGEVRVEKAAGSAPFSYQIRSVKEQSGFSVLSLTYPSPVATDVVENNTIPAELYLPDGAQSWPAPRPAVLCIHILDGDFELERMTCSMLASNGICALMFKLPYYGERSPPEGTRALARQPRRFLAALEQARADVRRTVDLLASRPEVDPRAIGVTGISLGGIVAASAAADEPRLRRALLVLAGGDLRAIIDHADELRQLKQSFQQLPDAEREAALQALQTVDPLTHAPKLRGRAAEGRVMMINAGEDEVVPRDCTEQLAAALGLAGKVVWLDGLGHYSAMAAMPDMLQRTVEFFGQDLPPDARRAEKAAAAPTAVQQGLTFVQQVARLLGEEPAENRCHLLDLEIAVYGAAEQAAFAAGIYYARAGDGRFKIDARTRQFGRIALGWSPGPWLLAGERILAAGMEEENGRAPILDEKSLTKLRAVAGALRAATIAPGVFEQLFAVAEGSEGGMPIVHVARRNGSAERLRLVLDPERNQVRRLDVEWGGGRAEVELRVFETGAPIHPGLFRPVPAAERQQVDGGDLVAIFRAVSQFALAQVAR
jgi:dienelactone hydrolase